MAKVVRLADYRQRTRPVYFNRGELRELLDLYSRRVSTGEWRDYAIDHVAGMAVFSIFRHAAEAPLFSIFKVGDAGGTEYLVKSGKQPLKRARSIGEALAVLDRVLVPVG